MKTIKVMAIVGLIILCSSLAYDFYLLDEKIAFLFEIAIIIMSIYYLVVIFKNKTDDTGQQ